ncbi:hypothetical protein BGX28_001396, partial [Mortierella sp. GBA30]
MQSSQSVNEIQNEMVRFGDGLRQAIVRHIQSWDNASRKLRRFNFSNAYKKNWARRKVFRAEYDWATTSLLRLALQENELDQLHGKMTDIRVNVKVLFVYGDARFNTHTKLPSLYSSSMGFFHRG